MIGSDPRSDEVRGAYVHVPFCAHRCGYCDFATVAGADDLADRYLAALEREISRSLSAPHTVATLFVGGGTPTRLTAAQLERLTAILTHWLPVEPGGEWTVEANPGTLDAEKVRVLAASGVNRISLGAQSFQPRLLAALERNHQPDEIARALDLIHPHFDRWSLDLIFGVPGAALADWQRDLEAALALHPSHLSCYGLVFEKGTPLWRARAAGTVRPVDEEIEAAMYEHTIARLASAGLAQYEISNFARLGHECRHNLIYWANEPYFGFGLGAARYLEGERAVNTRDLLAYLKRVEEGADATGPRERLEPEARARETAVLMLRRTKVGLDRADFRSRTAMDFDALMGGAARRFTARGLLDDDGARVVLTSAGVMLADSVFAALV